MANQAESALFAVLALVGDDEALACCSTSLSVESGANAGVAQGAPLGSWHSCAAASLAAPVARHQGEVTQFGTCAGSGQTQEGRSKRGESCVT